MRFLFVAYCISNPGGDSLIGVYKRCLRIGSELQARGHEVHVLCPGREKYNDRFTQKVAEQIAFLDLPLETLFEPDIDLQRKKYADAILEVAPDVVVIGEAPLAGSLLQCTIAAATLEIPVVIVDNAYSSESAARFVKAHGPTADAIMLTGLSTYRMANPPAYVCEVPPLVKLDGEQADRLLRELELSRERLVTVLGYEAKAEQLAIALLSRWPGSAPDFLFITRDLDGCRERVTSVAAAKGARVRVVAAPEEGAYFGLLRASRLVIGKCGFMQMSECLALGAPFIGVTYLGCFDPAYLPEPAPSLVHATQDLTGSDDTLRHAVRVFEADRRQLPRAHDGSFQAVERMADFLEKLPRAPRQVREEEREWFGYPRELISAAIAQLHPGEQTELLDWRVARLRRLNIGYCIDSVLPRYRVGGKSRWAVLWGRRYKTDELFEASLQAASTPDSKRRMLLASAERLMSIEHDAGETLLPKIEF